MPRFLGGMSWSGIKLGICTQFRQSESLLPSAPESLGDPGDESLLSPGNSRGTRERRALGP